MPYFAVGNWVWRQPLPEYGFWGPPDGADSGLDFRSVTECAVKGTADGQIGGLGLFAFPVDPGGGNGLALLGDDPKGIVSQGRRNALERKTGLTFTPTRLDEIIQEFYTTHADPAGLGMCRPLIPQMNGRLRLVWQGAGIDLSRPFDITVAADPMHSKVLSVRRKVIADVKALADQGKVHPDLPGKVLDAELAKYRTQNHLLWFDDPADAFDPIPRTTTFTDDFNRADSDTIGSPWTEPYGSTTAMQIVSNKLRFLSASNDRYKARYDSDLSGDDHYAQAVVNVQVGGFAIIAGVNCRFSASAMTMYTARLYTGGTEEILMKLVTGTETKFGSTYSYSTATDYTTYVEADGSTISCTVGANSESTTDTAITGNLRGGLGEYMFSPGDIDYDDWITEDLAAGGANPKGPLGHPLHGPFGGPIG